MEVGVPGRYIGDQDTIDAFVSKVGGVARWVGSEPASERTRCAACRGRMWLLSQLEAPTASVERILYIFACNTKGCKTPDVRALSYARKRKASAGAEAPADAKAEEKSDKGSGEWDLGGVESGGDDDWGLDGDKSDDEDGISSLLALRDDTGKGPREVKSNGREIKSSEKARAAAAPSSETVTTTTSVAAASPAFRPFFVLFRPEAAGDSESKKSASHARALLERLENEEKSLAEAEQWDREDDEDVPAEEQALDDFCKRVSRHPQQCVRYNFGGNPLLMSSKGPEKVPPCKCCGRARTFEMQLMPPLLSMLQPSACFEWGTLSVYTCPGPCAVDSFIGEWVYVESAL